jgi:hypothetical protein
MNIFQEISDFFYCFINTTSAGRYAGKSTCRSWHYIAVFVIVGMVIYFYKKKEDSCRQDSECWEKWKKGKKRRRERRPRLSSSAVNIMLLVGVLFFLYIYILRYMRK